MLEVKRSAVCKGHALALSECKGGTTRAAAFVECSHAMPVWSEHE